MKLILGQGNPGIEYANSRHNIGFWAVDTFAREHSAEFLHKSKFKADVAESVVHGEKILLVKPTTFYNETGQSARAIIDFYKINPASDVLVIHDDIALPFGTLRTRQKGSDAGNNGIKSLNAHIGADYWRLRIGIYNELRDRMHDADFVLGKFTKDDNKLINTDILPVALDFVEKFIRGKVEPTSRTVLPS